MSVSSKHAINQSFTTAFVASVGFIFAKLLIFLVEYEGIVANHFQYCAILKSLYKVMVV